MGVWERMHTCICMAESLRCSPQTITTLFIGYTSIQNKKFLKKGKENCRLVSENFLAQDKNYKQLQVNKLSFFHKNVFWNITGQKGPTKSNLLSSLIYSSRNFRGRHIFWMSNENKEGWQIIVIPGNKLLYCEGPISTMTVLPVRTASFSPSQWNLEWMLHTRYF